MIPPLYWNTGHKESCAEEDRLAVRFVGRMSIDSSFSYS